jgi:hypothetical protein
VQICAADVICSDGTPKQQSKDVCMLGLKDAGTVFIVSIASQPTSIHCKCCEYDWIAFVISF